MLFCEKSWVRRRACAGRRPRVSPRTSAEQIPRIFPVTKRHVYGLFRFEAFRAVSVKAFETTAFSRFSVIPKKVRPALGGELAARDPVWDGEGWGCDRVA